MSCHWHLLIGFVLPKGSVRIIVSCVLAITGNSRVLWAVDVACVSQSLSSNQMYQNCYQSRLTLARTLLCR